MGQIWMKITALTGSDFDGIQQSPENSSAAKKVDVGEDYE